MTHLSFLALLSKTSSGLHQTHEILSPQRCLNSILQARDPDIYYVTRKSLDTLRIDDEKNKQMNSSGMELQELSQEKSVRLSTNSSLLPSVALLPSYISFNKNVFVLSYL